MSEQTTDDNKGGAAAWYEGLPDDLKGHDSLKRYESLEGAARGLVHLQGLMGAPPEQLLRLPKPDDAEGHAKLWNTLGRPEAPDKYGIKPPEGSGIDEAGLSGFLAAMHGSGAFTPKMAEAAVTWFTGYQEQASKQLLDTIKTERETAVTALRGEWGQAYDAKTQAAFKVAEQLGGKDLREALEETGMGNHPAIIKAFAAVAEKLQEAGPPPGGRQEERSGVMTPVQAEAELAKMNNDAEIQKALHNENHPNHEFYVKQRLGLIKAKRATAAA